MQERDQPAWVPVNQALGRWSEPFATAFCKVTRRASWLARHDLTYRALLFLMLSPACGRELG